MSSYLPRGLRNLFVRTQESSAAVGPAPDHAKSASNAANPPLPPRPARRGTVMSAQISPAHAPPAASAAQPGAVPPSLAVEAPLDERDLGDEINALEEKYQGKINFELSGDWVILECLHAFTKDEVKDLDTCPHCSHGIDASTERLAHPRLSSLAGAVGELVDKYRDGVPDGERPAVIARIDDINRHGDPEEWADLTGIAVSVQARLLGRYIETHKANAEFVRQVQTAARKLLELTAQPAPADLGAAGLKQQRVAILSKYIEVMGDAGVPKLHELVVHQAAPRREIDEVLAAYGYDPAPFSLAFDRTSGSKLDALRGLIKDPPSLVSHREQAAEQAWALLADDDLSVALMALNAFVAVYPSSDAVTTRLIALVQQRADMERSIKAHLDTVRENIDALAVIKAKLTAAARDASTHDDAQTSLLGLAESPTWQVREAASVAYDIVRVYALSTQAQAAAITELTHSPYAEVRQAAALALTQLHERQGARAQQANQAAQDAQRAAAQAALAAERALVVEGLLKLLTELEQQGNRAMVEGLTQSEYPEVREAAQPALGRLLELREQQEQADAALAAELSRG